MKSGLCLAALLALAPVWVVAGEVRIEPAGVVPANHLKFYLHFPGPMERGEVFRFLRLVEIDRAGAEVTEVPEPFREVELWDETFARLTLWFHPGRQKPGVNLNVEIGPILEEGKRYRLEISAKWRSEEGLAPGGTVRYEFLAGPTDEIQPDPRAWKIAVNGRFVRVEAGEALDPESLRKRVSVLRGEEALSVKIESDGHGFRLLREEGWSPGSYRLVVDPRLEDLAGNSVLRPFNLNLEKNVGKWSEETIAIPFEVEGEKVP